MKKFNIIILILAVFATVSCYEDLGNYTYTDLEVITISGIAASYDKISTTDKLTIDPVVTSTDPNAVFDYFWGIYETNVQGYAPKVDTIAKTKSIDYLVNQPAKGWVLVFGAKNRNTGLMKIETASINIITPFTRGWYVLKDNGTETDMDQFLTPATITPDSRKDNVYSLVNGKKLAGKATLYSFLTDYKSTVTGTLGNTRALFAITDKDATVVNINTMKEIRGFNDLFFEVPKPKKPNAVFIGSAADYFINDGKLHSIYAMSANTGQFGYQQMRDATGSNYNLSKYFVSYWINDPILFDETSSSFISAGGAGNQVNKVSDAAGTAMPANNNNKTLLFMGLAKSSPLTAYACFADKTNSALRILATITGSVTSIKMVNDTLKTTDKAYNALTYCINQDETMIYFQTGNQIWSRNMSNKFEQLQFTVPADETVTFIRHKKYAPTGAELPYAYNYIMIATKVGNAYKIRMFTKTAGNLATTPSFTLEGTGSPGDVIYISPSVSQSTYLNTF